MYRCKYNDNFNNIKGILNGTTNFILTKMSEGLEFSDALKLAQEKGFAEADPTADIEGLDAARKVAIMGSIAFNSRVVLDDVYVEGITKLTAEDLFEEDDGKKVSSKDPLNATVPLSSPALLKTLSKFLYAT